MTRKAIGTDLFFPVAIDAFAHRPFDVLAHVHHVRHVAMACGALDAGFHVAFVRKVHGRVRMESVDAHPWRLFTGLRVRGELLNLGTVRLHVLVAHHALGDAGNRRGDRAVRVRVARETFHLVVDDVRFVRIGNRLRDATCGPENRGGRSRSDEGEHNGLYWPAAEGEEPSPAGEFLAAAAGEGYRRSGSGAPTPYHGYYYRMLYAQGANAPGGKKDYFVDGRLVDGFALIAWPADYGVSGVKTFLVSQEGTVYEKDLGEDTASAITMIEEFDPDSSWSAVAEPTS